MYRTKLQKILLNRNISYNTFAIICGVPKTNMYRYITGASMPSLDVAAKIGKQLNMYDIDDILSLFEAE